MYKEIQRVVDYVWKKAVEGEQPDRFVNRREYVRMATERIVEIAGQGP